MENIRNTYDEMQFLLDYLCDTNQLMSKVDIQDKFRFIIDSVLYRILSYLELDSETHYDYVLDCLQSDIDYDMMLEGLNREVIR